MISKLPDHMKRLLTAVNNSLSGKVRDILCMLCRAATDVGFLHPDILNVKQTDNCSINTAPPTKF